MSTRTHTTGPGERARSAGRRGFTLIECLVSIVILSIGLTGVAGCFAVAVLSNQKASHIQRATATAQDTIEDMRSRGFGGITEDEFPASEAVTSLPGGRREIEITNAYGGDPRLRHVSVAIVWREPGGAIGRVALWTIVGNRAGHVGS